jgi:hypothetical protein
MAPPPDDGHASLISANCGFIPGDWRAAQGRELPANAKATNNDKAIANAMPSATARGRGKPSALMAFSPQPRARETANRFWRHDDLIEVKDRPRIAWARPYKQQSHLFREQLAATKTNPKRIATWGRFTDFIAGAAGVSGDGDGRPPMFESSAPTCW